MTRRLIFAYLAFAVVASAGLTAWVVGCDRPRTIWSAEVKSPDGEYVAEARTVAIPVMPGADIQTTVVLKPNHGLSPPMETLGVEDGPYGMRKSSIVSMRWLGTDHLELLYKSGAVEPTFLAARCYGATIDFVEVAADPSGASR